MVATIDSNKELRSLKKGEKGFVSHFTNPNIAGKLMAMGVVPGAVVQVLRRAPFGGGLYVKADNICLALRGAEAASIILK